MAGWLHGVFVGEWLFVFPLCGFSLSLFCNYAHPFTHVSPRMQGCGFAGCCWVQGCRGSWKAVPYCMQCLVGPVKCKRLVCNFMVASVQLELAGCCFCSYKRGKMHVASLMHMQPQVPLPDAQPKRDLDWCWAVLVLSHRVMIRCICDVYQRRRHGPSVLGD